MRRGDLNFAITSVYGPIGDLEKISFLNEIKTASQSIMVPWIILGDFNMIRNMEESTGGNRNLGVMMEFNNTLSELNLMEVPLSGRTYTWSSKRPSPTFSRLDRVFLSVHWASAGASYNLVDLPGTASDHIPLLLNIKPHSQQRRYMRFENYWLMHREVFDIVRDAWTLPATHQNQAKPSN